MDSDGRPIYQPPSLIYTDGQGNPVQQQQVDWLSGYPPPAAVEFEACNAIELDRWQGIPFQCLLALAENQPSGMAAAPSSSAWNNTDLNLGIQDPIPAQYDLNLPEQSMAESFAFGGINFPFAPVTPQKTVEGARLEPATAVEKDVRFESGHGGLPCGETTDRQAVFSVLNHDKADGRNVTLVPDPVPDSSSTVGLATLENPNREKVDLNVIDLNKAPPKKKPKRKKHVPKVRVEGQKPKTPKQQTPKQPKRKYERKKESSPPAAAGNGEVENPNADDCATSNADQSGMRKNKKTNSPTSPVTKEGTPRIRKKYTRKVAQENASADNPTGTVGEPAASEAISGGKPGCTTPPWEATGESVDPHGPPLPARKSCRRALDFTSEEAGIQSFTKKPSSPSMMSEPVAKSQSAAISFGDGIEVRKQNTRTGSPFDFENSVKELLKSYSPKAGNQAKTKEKEMAATHCMQQHSTPMSLSNASGCSSLVRTLTEVGGTSGSANTNCSPSEPAINMAGHFYNGLSIYQTLPWALMPECRKKRSEKAQNSAVSSIPVVSPAARRVNYLTNYTHPHENGLLSGTVGKGESAGLLQYKLHNFSPLNEIERSTKRRSKAPIRVQDMGALVTIPHHNNRHIQNLNRPEVRMGALLAGPQAATLKKPKKNSKRDSLGRYASLGANDKGQHGMMVSFTRNQFSGSLETLFNLMLTVDELAEQLKFLNINRESPNVTFTQRKELVPYKGRKKKQNAMVVYRGDDRIVPYQPGKRKRPRAKVELDAETIRVFNLLLKNIDSEGIDGTDEAKAKYWEEERRIFRGRTDSFIARMHLVQGDRRFSRWKGSVVDSVIGVFLTQNVSDHLSSSAFMSMAARFPIKRHQEPQWEEGGTQSIVINPTVSMPDDECLNWDEMSNQSISDQISTTLGDPRQEDTAVAHSLNSTRSTSSNIGLTPGKENYDESTISQNSSQNSNSPVSQTFDNIKESCTETNSQEVDTCDGGAQLNRLDGGSSSFVELLQKAQFGSTMLPKEQSTNLSGGLLDIVESSNKFEKEKTSQNTTGSNLIDHASPKGKGVKDLNAARRRAKSRRVGDEIKDEDWEALRRSVLPNGIPKERAENAKDSVDWEAVRRSDVDVIADTIKARGMNNLLAARIKEFLDKLITYHGSIDLEWLRDVHPDKAKEYLLSFNGLGLKSVECVRLLTLHHLAFPVDTNVGRIAVRLGWVPLQPLPESLQLHLLEMYPILDTIQKYLWPRLCKLDQKTLYELHYQLITFGKVFCTKSKPNCNACPMRGECRHFASAFASARLSLPGPEEKRLITAQPQDRSTFPDPVSPNVQRSILPPPTICEESQPSVSQPTSPVPEQENHQSGTLHVRTVKPRDNCQPIIEEPLSPEPQCTEATIDDIEDAFYEDPDEIPTLKLNGEIPSIQLDVHGLAENLANYLRHNMELREGDLSLDLVAIATEATYIPPPKLKNISRLRTEHQVYELQDSHPLVQGLERREADDPSPYLLAIWTPGETAKSVQPPEMVCPAQSQGKVCDKGTCPSCCSFLEARRQIVRGTILIPCRTAMRGSFPLNGTYYQVNEVFADHETSLHPIDVPREWLWDLPRRTVYFGTSVPTIFRGLTTEQIQQCFWKGFVCVRGFDRRTKAPRPLQARLHFPASKMKGKEKGKNVADDDE